MWTNPKQHQKDCKEFVLDLGQLKPKYAELLLRCCSLTINPFCVHTCSLTPKYCFSFLGERQADVILLMAEKQNSSPWWINTTPKRISKLEYSRFKSATEFKLPPHAAVALLTDN